MAEGNSLDRQDQNAVGMAALTSLEAEGQTSEKKAETLEVRTGNVLIDQFQPRYFAMAFAFCFKYGTACPDVFNTASKEPSTSRRQQKDSGAPTVDIHDWAAIMSRRVEAQFRRDWNFGFVLWNYLFRTMVNLQGNTYFYSQGGKKITSDEFLQGSTELRDQLLRGKYTDITGAQKSVQGDFSKVQHVPGLSAAAKKLAQDCNAKCRNIPGTHETRNLMRQQTHAYRVCYGTSVFLTFSPSERDSTLMLRLARTRDTDPALQQQTGNPTCQQRSQPPLDKNFIELDPQVLAQVLPDYDERRAILAGDPLSCADGFWTLVQLVLRHLFGVRWCPNCPNCAKSDRPCTDAFGSNATAMGGVLGRVDAALGSIECQRSGALHAHFQVFLQCLHQFTPLSEIVALGTEAYLDLVKKYKAYNAHVRRNVYCNPSTWQAERDAVEKEWPEYRNSVLMLSRPGYQSDARLSAACWKQKYLEEDVEELQKHKQHHVHLPKDTDPQGPRLPLSHCRDKRDPTKCKAGFPRHNQLTEETLIVCDGLARQMDMPVKGKKSMLGSLWGPVNDPELNGTHPALLAALRCNSDLQLPYRFPLNEDIHSHKCQDEKCRGASQEVRTLVREAQRNQAAQAGYGCDYQNKRLPIAIHEIKEWNKGNKELAEELEGKPVGYAASRVQNRFITDCFCRGVCRGSVECSNLLTRNKHGDPVEAESIRTAPVVSLPLQYGLNLLQAAADAEPWPVEPQRWATEPKWRNKQQKQARRHCPFWTLYGSRGRNPRVHELSAYEFAMHFEFKKATHPWTINDKEQHHPPRHEARLTDTGKEKVRWHRFKAKLLPGVDYHIREPGAGEEWIPFGACELAQPFKHDWVMMPRKRPHVPVLFGAQGSKQTAEDQAMKLLLLFRPWVNDRRDASDDLVAFVGDLFAREAGATDWLQAARLWLGRRGFPTESVKRHAAQFCFVHCLPRELQPGAELEANSDNEDLEDVPCFFDQDPASLGTQACLQRKAVS